MKKIAMLAIALAAATGAQADIVSTSDSFGLAVTNWTHNLGASQFDGTLGTLNSAKFTFSYDIEQSFRAENTGATADILTPEAKATFLFRKLLSNITSTTITGGAAPFNASAWDGVNDYGGTSGFNFGAINANGGVTFTVTGLALADLIGTGTLGSAGFNVRALGEGKILTDNGNLESSISTVARYNLTVDYDFTRPSLVPEPGSLALVGIALAGASLLRRKAKQA